MWNAVPTDMSWNQWLSRKPVWWPAHTLWLLTSVVCLSSQMFQRYSEIPVGDCWRLKQLVRGWWSPVVQTVLSKYRYPGVPNTATNLSGINTSIEVTQYRHGQYWRWAHRQCIIPCVDSGQGAMVYYRFIWENCCVYAC